MHTQIKLHHVSPEQLLKCYVERRLNFAASRFGERIARVTTRISAPSAASSSTLLCHMSATFHPFGVVTAEASDSDVYTAIDRCADKLTRRCESKSLRSRRGSLSRLSIRTPGHLDAA
mgnify:CR=1 FL=1